MHYSLEISAEHQQAFGPFLAIGSLKFFVVQSLFTSFAISGQLISRFSSGPPLFDPFKVVYSKLARGRLISRSFPQSPLVRLILKSFNQFQSFSVQEGPIRDFRPISGISRSQILACPLFPFFWKFHSQNFRFAISVHQLELARIFHFFPRNLLFFGFWRIFDSSGVWQEKFLPSPPGLNFSLSFVPLLVTSQGFFHFFAQN